jgi:tRNA (cytidine/uridine-2'-O-)-methyltransferase
MANMQSDQAVPLTVALYQPDIPQNAGTILRMCACLGLAAAIIEPAGFPASDRHFRRAGMDYLDHLAIARHIHGQPSTAGAAPICGDLCC